MGGEGRADLGHRHGAEPGLALGRSELGHTGTGVEELAVDADGAAEEVDRSTVRPKHSPWRRPMPAANTMSARYRSGTAATSASTSPTLSGTTSASLRLGRPIPTHGDEAIRRSPTAALKMVDTQR